MRSYPRRLMILCTLCLSYFATPARAQLLQPQGFPNAGAANYDHPSHRRLPLANGKNRPKLKQLLNNPEFKELRKQYSQMESQERATEYSVRLPGETRREARDRQQKLFEHVERSFLPTEPNDIEFEIKSVFEDIGKKLGTGIAETLQPDAVEFEPSDLMSWDPKTQLMEEINRQLTQAKRQVAEAKELLERKWPKDSVAPEEWFEKVQPFINSEVIEQLTEASRQFKAQEDVPPSERRFQDVERIPSLLSRDESTTMFDSFMHSIDKQGTDWLKSSDKEKSSLWKSLRQSAQSGIKRLNRSMTENSQRQANAPNMQTGNSIANSGTQPRGARPRGNAQTRTSASGSAQRQANSWLWTAVVIALLAIGGLAFAYRDQLMLRTSTEARGPLLASRIRDRDSLLAACHMLASQLFGVRSRFWHHRKLFENLSETLSEHSPRGQNVVDQLSQIYETARYSPVRLADDEFSRARDLFATLQNDLQTSA